ncbi:uncharacterized protein LOC111598163 [Drosophila hydei]|uniref:Uncharacterized protein LOC111598163 n=1 Tax=Drosophila hydei TaxID=7224 RepID=A0A6J1LRX2_DROHY|nr:uncharacterized protein LOC111598163 [Drosophila hydei]
MKNLRFFRDACNDLLHRHVNLDVFSIWPTRHAQNRRQYVIRRAIKNWLPWLFWFCVVYSFLGLIHNFVELVRAKLVATRPVSMWRVRCFYGLRDTIIRQMRVMGSLVMIVCWLMLFIGLLWSKPIYMKPWLTVTRFILPFDLVLWSLEVTFGREEFSWQAILSFALPCICQFFVDCLKRALEEPNQKLFKA